MKQIRSLLTGLTIITVIAALVLQAVPGALAAPPAGAPASSQGVPNGSGKELWQHVPGTPPARAGAQPAVKARRADSYTLNRSRHGQNG